MKRLCDGLCGLVLLSLALGCARDDAPRWDLGPPEASVVDAAHDASAVDTVAFARDVRDVTAPPTEIPRPDDVSDVRDVACPAERPARCGTSCCAGPCHEGTCEELVGVTGGPALTCAWSRAGNAWCWGNQPLFTTVDMEHMTPFRLPHLTLVRQMSVGARRACAVTEPWPGLRELHCWAVYARPARVALDADARPEQVAVGVDHVCVRVTGGRVRCFGENARCQLGVGFCGAGVTSGSSFDAPQVVRDERGGELTGVTDLVAGERHTCARMVDGRVYCWGSDESGQLGNGRVSPACMGDRANLCDPVARPVAGLSDVARLTAGARHVCAAKADGTMWCWGENDRVQLCGAQSGSVVTRPTQVAWLRGVREVTAGEGHTCVTRVGADGGAFDVVCCGQHMHGQLPPSPQGWRVVEGLAGEPRALASGRDHTCALTAAGALACWGDARDGQLAYGDEGFAPRAVEVEGLRGAVALALGERYTCALTDAGGVTCLGSNRAGQLGASGGLDRPTPAVVGGLTGVRLTRDAVRAGSEHSCAIRDGVPWCWGNASLGRLGRHEDWRVQHVPGVVPGVSEIEEIGAGAHFTCTRGRQGVLCWGSNYQCQTTRGFDHDAGTCRTEPHTDAQRVALAVNPEGLAVGAEHACLWSGGGVWCWGDNEYGQALGTPVRTPVGQVRQVEGLPRVTQVSAGAVATCAKDADGDVWCWGDNRDGTLGRTGEGPSPGRVGAIRMEAVTVRVGARFACALVNGGRVLCWGSNHHGQLGARAPSEQRSSTAPVAVERTDGSALDGVVDLALGAFHACARRNDGSVWCWGSNLSGQLGRGNASVRVHATRVAW